MRWLLPFLLLTCGEMCMQTQAQAQPWNSKDDLSAYLTQVILDFIAATNAQEDSIRLQASGADTGRIALAKGPFVLERDGSEINTFQHGVSLVIGAPDDSAEGQYLFNLGGASILTVLGLASKSVGLTHTGDAAVQIIAISRESFHGEAALRFEHFDQSDASATDAQQAWVFTTTQNQDTSLTLMDYGLDTVMVARQVEGMKMKMLNWPDTTGADVGTLLIYNDSLLWKAPTAGADGLQWRNFGRRVND